MSSSTTKQRMADGLKIMKKLLSNYKKELIILGVLAIVSSLAGGVLPYLVGKIFDNLLSPGKNLIIFLATWACVNLISNIIDWKGGIKKEELGTIIELDYVVNGFSKLLEMPFSFHKNNKIGNITHRIMRSAVWLNRIIGRILIDLAPQFLTIIVALGITFFVNSTLTFVLLVGIAVYTIILLKILPPVVDLQTKMHLAYQKSYGDAFDALINTQAVKQATAEQYENKKLRKEFRLKSLGFFKKLIVIWRGLSFYQRFIILLTQIIIFIYSAFAIRDGHMTIGQLVMFTGYAGMIFNPFIVLGNNWQAIQAGLMSLVQSEKILRLPSENYRPEKMVQLRDISGKIEFQNLSFYYKKGQKILENINIKIEPGEVIALVGESGVGKSTLIELISGFYFTKQGKLLIDECDIKKIDLKFLRRQISVVPQEILLFNDTVKNNIKYGSFGSADEEIKKAAELAHADEFIENFPNKYNQVVGERGIKLSAGQKQRIAIARAILKNPKILILDEPTSSLDALSEQFIQESLEKLMKGRTTIIIAHRLSTVRQADKIIVLEKGRVAEQGRHEDLIKKPNGIYRRLYELQIGLN